MMSFWFLERVGAHVGASLRFPRGVRFRNCFRIRSNQAEVTQP